MSFLINPYVFPAAGQVLWTPAQISTALWLNAADASTITTVSDAVSEWRDKSGNARNAYQTIAANRPVYDVTGFNGKPTVKFNGINSQLDLVQFAQESNQNLWAVVDTTSLGTAYRMFLARLPSNTSTLAFYIGTVNANYRPSVYWNGSARAIQVDPVQRKAIFRWSFTTGSPGSALTQVDAGAISSSEFTATTLAVWSSIAVSNAQQALTNVSEIIMTPSTPAQSDIEKIEGYLAHDWGLTANLPAGHPYKTTPPYV